jgi:hypothetical protein
MSFFLFMNSCLYIEFTCTYLNGLMGTGDFMMGISVFCCLVHLCDLSVIDA